MSDCQCRAEIKLEEPGLSYIMLLRELLDMGNNLVQCRRIIQDKLHKGKEINVSKETTPLSWYKIEHTRCFNTFGQ